MGTPLATLASRPGRRAAATLTLLLFLITGCAAEAGTPAQPVEGLLVLTKGDVANLAVLAARRDPSETVAIGLPLPANDMTWISAGSDGVLLGSSAEGAVATSDPVDPRGSAADIAGLEWKPIEAADEAGAGLPPARFASWAPGGGRFAAIGGRPARRRRCQRPPGRPEGRHVTRRSPSIDRSSRDRRSGSTPIGWRS